MTKNSIPIRRSPTAWAQIVATAPKLHTKPWVTLNIYASLSPGEQEDAAAVVDAALNAALQE
jgi:hypothetical protein